MKSKKHKHIPSPSVHRELYRHPHYFLLLLSFVFLGAMAAFLLVLSNVTMKQSQDLRQKAAGEATLPDLAISGLSAERATNLITDPVVVRVTVINRGGVAITQPFTVALDYGQNVPFSETFFTVSPGKVALIVNPPLSPNEERVLTYTIAGGSLAPGSYSLYAAPDPRYENAIQETSETDQAYAQSGFSVVQELVNPPPTTVNPPTTSGSGENLFFTAAHKLELYKANSNESIKLGDILSGESYKVRQTVRIQNVVKKADSTDARSVTVQFRANDSAVASKNFAMSQLQKSADGIDLVFETTVTGKTSNEFKTTLDSANTVAETNEGDNTLSTTYSYQVTTTTVSQSSIAAACNKYCANDGECSYGLKCSWNKCRHPDNLNDERCAPASSVVPGCNITCTANRDCAAGLTCSSGKCRNPKATSSDTCQASSTGTVITTKTAEKTNTTGQKGATATQIKPTPTPKPTATPTPKTSTAAGSLQTPTPTIDTSLTDEAMNPDISDELMPIVEPEQTVANEVLAWLQQVTAPVMEQVNEVPKIVLGWFGFQEVADSTSLWFWLIGGGVLLILFILLFSFLGSRKESAPPAMKPPQPHTRPTPATKPASTQPLSVQPTPKSYHALSTGGVAPAAVATGAVVATAAPTSDPNKASPNLMAPPRPLPAAAVNKPPTPAIAPPPTVTPSPAVSSPTVMPVSSGSTMVSKLQDRGVIKPAAPTPPHTAS